MPFNVRNGNSSTTISDSSIDHLARPDTPHDISVWEKIKSFFSCKYKPEALECIRTMCHPPAGTTREDVADRFEQLRRFAHTGFAENIQSGRHGENNFSILDENSHEMLSVNLDDAGIYTVECQGHSETHNLTPDTRLCEEHRTLATSIPPPETVRTAVDYDAVWSAWANPVPGEECSSRNQALQKMRDCLNNGNPALDLSHYQLTSLPDHLPPNITTLNVTSNQLFILPTLPSGLLSLTADENQLASLPTLPSTLQSLIVNRNKLYRLPMLPSGLERFDAEHNHLTSLPMLPSGLLSLAVSENQLTYLPTLPSTLQSLIVNRNKLSSLPMLPSGLERFDAEHNHLTSLPALPSGLGALTVRFNRLTSLPTLPSGLLSLTASDNQLTSLPMLPSGLLSLAVSKNQLTYLPTLPATLQSLAADSNQLTSLPALPSTLQSLTAEFNQLTSLPALPSTLQSLAVDINQLTSLPVLPSALQSLSADSNQLTSLPDLSPGLLTLFVSRNQLIRLPELPPGLEKLAADENQLTSLPMLPSGLKWFTARHNQLTSLPALPSRLERFDAEHNQLTSLPALPSELWLLIAGHNQLTSLPELQPGLRSLTVEYNQLASLPALPSGLQSLIVEYNQLTGLPALPPGLYRLTAGQNRLTSLPALPSGLERFDAEHNHLISLPALPSGLRMLTAGHNQLTSLPALPSGLTSLTVDHNQLTSLPVLPSELTSLTVDHNQLDRLPVLPSELGSLIAGYNQLTSLPASIADMFSGDCLVELEGNPLSDLTRQALWNITNAPGYSGPLIDWSMVTPPVSQATRALYLAVANWLTLAKGGDPDLTDKWQTFGQENDAASFGAFLARLSKTENCRKDPAFKTQISSWLIQLAEDDSLRAKTFSMATEATSSCEDRVTLALNQMKNVQLVHHAAKGKYDNNYSELVSVGREMFRLDKLEQIARDKVNTLRTLGDYDEIEVYLGYQNKLKEALGLTSVTAGMRFFDISHITDSDLQAAELQVKTAENSQFSEWILQWEPLRNVLEHTYPERWEALCEKKISDYESVYRSLEKELKKNKLNNDTDAERTIGTKAMENAEEKFLTGLRPLRDEMLGGYL